MYKAKAFFVEIWPGEVRIHQNYEEEGMQTIELDAEQIDDFCEVLKRQAVEAKALAVELERYEQQRRADIALREPISFGDEDGKA